MHQADTVPSTAGGGASGGKKSMFSPFKIIEGGKSQAPLQHDEEMVLVSKKWLDSIVQLGRQFSDFDERYRPSSPTKAKMA